MDILRGISGNDRPEILLGIDDWDDVGIVSISEDLALIQNIDVITPVTNDPFKFGQIATANALSDVYAKGGTPVAAMDILCLPASLSRDVGKEIIRGVMSKLSEAKTAFLGGHTVVTQEPMVGLAVSGLISPAQIIKKSNSLPGDKLILTKPIGTGIIVTANKKGRLASQSQLESAISVMVELNKKAMDIQYLRQK